MNLAHWGYPGEIKLKTRKRESPKGSAHHGAMPDDKVERIFLSKLKSSEIAEIEGVHVGTVHAIKRRAIRTDVTDRLV